MDDTDKELMKIEEKYVMRMLKNIKALTLTQHNLIEETTQNDISTPYRERVHALFEDVEKKLEDILLEMRSCNS
jgi:hypothetical protein